MTAEELLQQWYDYCGGRVGLHEETARLLDCIVPGFALKVRQATLKEALEVALTVLYDEDFDDESMCAVEMKRRILALGEKE